jgi:SAM-dependent methyltransferase
MKDWKIYERVDPDNRSTYYLYRIHLDRYLTYASLARDLVVLDVGCAYGFGSGALGREASQVMGIDTSAEIVREAKKRYGGRNIDFAVMSAEHLGFREHSIEGAYAFEVVEHLSKPDLFFSDLEAILTKTGFVILSTPNRLVSTDKNPFHVTEYTWDEFNSSLEKHFSSVTTLGISHHSLFENLIKVRRLLPSNLVELLKGNSLFEFLIDRIARQGKRSEGESSSGLLAVCYNPWDGVEEKMASAELLGSEPRLMVGEGQDP